ncbi:MAG: mechanosensitive ion channel family protein [Phycisphaerales bacterium]
MSLLTSAMCALRSGFFSVQAPVATLAQPAGGSDASEAANSEGAGQQTAADEVEDAPKSFDEAMGEIQETLAGVWGDFVSYIPYFVAGLAVLVLTAFLAFAVRAIARKMAKRSEMRQSLRDLIAQLAFIATWAIGLLLTAMIVFPGLTPTKALGGLGLLSVAVGFAFKDIFENFFAGVLLLWRFPFEPGDYIECEDIMGKVEEIEIRMTLIRRTTDELVVVPNSFLFTNPVEVLTNRKTRRITIMTGVAYDVDVDEALPIIREAVESCDSVSSEHEVQVFANGFGSSSIDIEVAWWSDSTPLGVRKSRGEVVRAIKRALDDREIEIPFPYRTLTFKEPLPTRRVGDSSNGERSRAERS